MLTRPDMYELAQLFFLYILYIEREYPVIDDTIGKKIILNADEKMKLKMIKIEKVNILFYYILESLSKYLKY